MTTEPEIITLDVEATEPPADAGRWARAWDAFERLLVRLGDRLNPILVKETRQALKSQQFLFTFALLLLFAWGWSILGVAVAGPGVAWGSHGENMFFGYFVILAIPLLVVVPFSAFRSLAAEQESRTFELLSITAMSPRQIIAGKLGSALLQMSIYLSAVSPCLAFTYLLRGIDLLTILYFLFWVTVGSLACSALALFLATASLIRQIQILPTIGAVLGAAAAAWIGILLGGVFLFEEGGSANFHDREFWVINAAILTAVVAYFAMVCEAAVARLAFASDNRSTRLRIIMVAQFALFTGWMTVVWILEQGFPAVPFMFAIIAGLHWYAMGALMTGESPVLSQRVKRNLPQSFLGRMLSTWFYPGPGAGYGLALCGLVATMLLMLVAMVLDDWVGFSRAARFWGRMPPISTFVIFGILGISYVVAFLGVGLLLMRAIRRVAPVGLLLSVLLQVMLVAFGCGVPMVIEMSSSMAFRRGYSLLHVTNPIYTLVEMVNRPAPPTQTPALLVLVPGAALVVFLLNLPSLARELRNVRIAKPRRVAEEDAVLAALRHPQPGFVPQNPWDH
ncbi:MAG: hypothetical protein JW809_01320 [Pirellulales bacterium]|nr:hypothetical protein [Pirellulales bacterium]